MKQIFLPLLLCLVAMTIFGGLSAQSQQLSQDLIIEVDLSRLARDVQQIVAGEVTFAIAPLLPETSRFRSNWFIARPQRSVTMSTWDLAHHLVANNPAVVYAEPDDSYIANYSGAPVADRSCEESNYTEDWPHPATVKFAWHLDAGFTQLRSARQDDGASKVRIAHCDTGYDPSHISTPKYLLAELQRNFIDGENQYSAVDIGSEGLLNQPGHGTSTLAVLAGNRAKRPQNNYDDYVGAAPFAEVVPIRVSRSVILYKSSALVKALYYIMEPQVHCDVLTMSMGGVASKYWADAVNDCYEHGLVLVTAAGNNFGTLPTVNVVFPARFNRVIAVCGATYDQSPYFKYDVFSFKMQGNFGPQEVMSSAIAAYSPNMVWATMGCVDKFHLDGGGTSAATPQIAAAAALWLQKYQGQQYEHPWQRVNAVRNALFSSAYKGTKDWHKYYGNGILRAKDALAIPPKLDAQPIEKDEVSFPIWTILFGSREDRSAQQRQMLAVELLRLEHNSPELQKLFAAIAATGQATAEQKAQIRAAVAQLPYASTTVVQLLEGM